MTKGRSDYGGVEILIHGVDAEAWDLIRRMFRFLPGPERAGEIRVPGQGTLLTDPSEAGRLYAKGIFVGLVPGMENGYDLDALEVDIDRKMADPWSLRSKTAALWRAAMALDAGYVGRAMGLMERGAKDAEGIADGAEYTWNKQALEPVAAYFEAAHGKDVVPVESTGKARDLAHVGIKAVVVAKPILDVLRALRGSEDTRVAALLEPRTTPVQWDELTDAEKATFELATSLLARSEPRFDATRVSVTIFADPKTLGRFRDGAIELSRSILSSFRETIATLVHEWAHHAGHDGDVAHERAIEDVFAGIVATMAGVRCVP